MTGNLVTIFGASGFLGRHTVRTLARNGWRIRAVCRKPNLAMHLLPAGQVGQIQLVKADVNDGAAVARALEGADAAVNLVGVLSGVKAQGFASIHIEAARRIGRAAREADTGSLVHMSALGARANAASLYAQSKAAGEAALRKEFPGAVVLRPSVVFGPEDHFFNKFASLARFAPALPLIGGGKTKFQPVYAADVAAAILRVLTDTAVRGKIFELGGPKIYSFEELLRFILAETGRQRRLVPVPFALAGFMGWGAETANAVPAAICRFFGGVPSAPLLTPDQIRMLEDDNIVSPGAPGFAELGIKPQPVEAVVPGYLWRFHPKGQFKELVGTSSK